MKRRFVDTWFWKTLIVSTEPLHKEAFEFFNKYTYQGDMYYTSASIIAETTTSILFSKSLIKAPEVKLRPVYAFKFFEDFKAALGNNPQLEILPADSSKVREALELLAAHFRSNPKLSYFDCESVVLCRAHNIPEILTHDSDYESLGLPVDEDWKAFLEKKE